MNSNPCHLRSLSELAREIRIDLQQFVQTRAELLRQELKGKAAQMKRGISQGLFGVMLLATAMVLFPMMLAALVATGFGDSPFRWVFAFLIVGTFWSIIGATALYALKRRFTQIAVAPRKTIEVLDGDKQLLRSETKHL